MKDNTVLITGCSSGIGLHVAQALAARGYQVLATARNDADVVRLRSLGLHSERLDLTDGACITTAVEQTLQRTGGRLYALFNNGAYGQPGAVEDLTTDVLRAQFECNFFGWHELTRQVIPIMRRQGYGRIIQNSSVLGLVALKYRGAYNATKFALEGLSDTLRMELHGSGVFVSLIEPGPIQSRFRANAERAFQRHIDALNSAHRDAYVAVAARLARQDSEPPFTLGPEAVLKPVIHALESRRPRVRYYVTVPTHALATLKRLLPHALLDRLLTRIAAGEYRQRS